MAQVMQGVQQYMSAPVGAQQGMSQYVSAPVGAQAVVMNGVQPVIANGYPNQQRMTNGSGPTLIAAHDHYGALPGHVHTQQTPRTMVHRSKGAQHIPLAKCRVLYLGSAVPLETAVGMDAVQMPLRERYPCTDADTEVPGIDAWLTVFSSGMLIQYVADKTSVSWFPISSLHVCAAVKCIVQVNGATGERTPKFVPLDSEAARSSRHPPMFATIMRRTKGVKVLECHVFIAKSDQAAMALVHSATHAYEHKELWIDEQPPPEMYAHTAPAQIVAAEPTQGHVHTLYNEESNGVQAPNGVYNKPPLQGYFYTPGKDLVKHYNVSGGAKMAQPIPPHVHQLPQHTHQMPPQPPHVHQMPPPPPHVHQMPPQPPHMHQMPPQPPHMHQMPPQGPHGHMVPPEYFSDWDAYGGSPVALFPGPYISPEEYERQNTVRRTKQKRRRSPKRRSPTRRVEHSHDHHHGRHRDPSPESCGSFDEYVYERRPGRGPDPGPGPGRPRTPPVDYGPPVDPYGYHDEIRYDHGGAPQDDFVLYASRYMEKGRPSRHHDPPDTRDHVLQNMPPRGHYDRERDDPYERRGERRTVAYRDQGPADPYDHYPEEPYGEDVDYDMYKRGGSKPYDNLERELGYYP